MRRAVLRRAGLRGLRRLPIDKPAGRPCLHLTASFACGIHDRLRDRGFPGCAVFDCFGAGQQVTQGAFSGRDWRTSPDTAGAMFDVVTVVRQLHELLWHLAEALALVPGGALHDELVRARDAVTQLTAAGPDVLAGVDAGAHRQQVGRLLEQVSQAVRAEVRGGRRDRRGADLVGARLRGADLRGVSLRGAYLLGADLRGADLHRADLLGADLRAADVRGARLASAVFLTQPQLDAARGDTSTTLPAALSRPRHWPTAGGRRP